LVIIAALKGLVRLTRSPRMQWDESSYHSGEELKSSEYHGVERIAVLHLVAARFDRCRRDDIEQRFDHFGGERLFGKLWLLPRCPGTARHHSPVALGDRRSLDSYLVHAIDDCSLSCSNPLFSFEQGRRPDTSRSRSVTTAQHKEEPFRSVRRCARFVPTPGFDELLSRILRA
jgi:hypothetical protein